ncbi:MAG: hypothetical protein R6V86_03970 [Spirochaetia bacterium]
MHGGKGGVFARILGYIRFFFSTMDQSHRNKVTEVTEFEVKELENLFVLLLMGSFTGVPSPPSFVAAELLPHLEHEIKVLNERAKDSFDSLADMASLLDID